MPNFKNQVIFRDTNIQWFLIYILLELNNGN